MCGELADRVEDSGAWLHAFIEADLPGGLLHAMIARVARVRCAEWERLVLQCLERDQTRAAAAVVVLTLRDPPSALLQRTLQLAATIAKNIEYSIQDVPDAILIQLLSHTEEKVRTAAAIGVWLHYKGSQIPGAVRPAWETTVTRCISELDQSEQYWLTDLLKANETLAVDWLASSFHSRRLASHLLGA